MPSAGIPLRPSFVRIIVPYAPAGVADIMARLMGQWLSERLGQQFIIENRPGANGNIGTEAVVRAPADGYTLLMVGSWNAINATLHGRSASCQERSLANDDRDVRDGLSDPAKAAIGTSSHP
jgi:tripartite-type tricarboxylate transporter receptor subunit TctC